MCCSAAGTASSSPPVYFMAQEEAHGAPVGRRSSSSTSPATGMWESPRQMQTQQPFPSWSWSPYNAGGGAVPGPAIGAHHLAAAPGSSLPSEHVHDHAWNQSAPITEARGGNGNSYTGNFLSLLEAKDVTPEMFEDVPAACDYLGGGVGTAGSGMAGHGLGTVDVYSVASSVLPPAKRETASSPLLYSGDSAAVHESGMGCMPCYDQEVKPESQLRGFGAPTAAFLQQVMIPGRVELQSALGYSGMGSERLESFFGLGGLPDAGSFSGFRSTAELMSSSSSRQEQDTTRPGMGSSCSGNGAATSVATRRKPEERVGGNVKKSKQEASKKASPPKPQEPKVKLGEKITALQQIVSPFGKTDTASVLFETIKYIKFLHDQIRLFSEPYMAKSTYKGHVRFGGAEKGAEEGNRTEHDLRGRGLCLVPVSLTSQVYHGDTLPDCWAPAYRSCLYR